METVEEALTAIRHPGGATVQVIFNAFRLKPAEQFFPAAREADVGIITRVPLASGLLTGKLRRDSTFAPDEHRAFNHHGEAFDRGETFSGVDYELGLEAARQLQEVVPPGMTLAQFALRWILLFPEVSCAIPGARNPAQVEGNASAADLPPLSEEQVQVRSASPGWRLSAARWSSGTRCAPSTAGRALPRTSWRPRPFRATRRSAPSPVGSWPRG